MMECVRLGVEGIGTWARSHIRRDVEVMSVKYASKSSMGIERDLRLELRISVNGRTRGSVADIMLADGGMRTRGLE